MDLIDLMDLMDLIDLMDRIDLIDLRKLGSVFLSRHLLVSHCFLFECDEIKRREHEHKRLLLNVSVPTTK